MGVRLGVDLGGTFTKIALVGDGGAIRARSKFETSPGQGVESWVARLATAARKLGRFRAAGVAVPGLLDREAGAVIRSPNLPSFDGVPLRAPLERALDTKVVLENDANAAAFGEGRAGAGRKWRDFLLATVGTGVGGGLILGRKLFIGPGGMAAELGHLSVERPGRPCGCGNLGCVETVASITGMLATAAEACEKVGIEPPATGEALAVWFEDSDAARRRIAKAAFDRAGKALGLAFAHAAILLDLRRFLVGGGGAASLERLRPSISDALVSHTYGRPLAAFEVRGAALGDDAGALGAALLAPT